MAPYMSRPKCSLRKPVRQRQLARLIHVMLTIMLVTPACNNGGTATPPPSIRTTQPTETTATTRARTTAIPTTISTAAPVEVITAVAPSPLELPPPEMVVSLEARSPIQGEEAFVDSGVVSIAVGGPGLVAVGFASDGFRYADAAVWVSSDGRAWDRLPDTDDVFSSEQTGYSDGDQWMADIVAWQGGFVAVGSDGRGQNAEYDAAVWVSENGIHWTRVPDQPSLGGPKVQWMNSVTVGGPGLVGVGEDSATDSGPIAAVWLSEDGINWTRVDSQAIEGSGASEEDDSIRVPRGFGGAAMNDVAAGGPGLIAVGVDDPYFSGRGVFGGDPAVWTSTDGLVWDQILLDNGSTGADTRSSIRSIVVGPNGIAAIGGVGGLPLKPGRGLLHHYGAVWISQDGIDWSLVAVLDDAELRTFAGAGVWDGDSLIVVGAGIEPEPDTGIGPNKAAIVWTTPDLGETWYEIARNEIDELPGNSSPIAWAPGFTLDYYSDAMSDVITFNSQIVAVGGSESAGIVWLAPWPTD